MKNVKYSENPIGIMLHSIRTQYNIIYGQQKCHIQKI